MEKVKIAVLVSGGGTNLQALIDAQGSVITSGKITLVVSNARGAYALERARKAGIATETVIKKECAGQQSRIHCTRLAGTKADTWFLRQHPKTLALKLREDLGRANRDNVIDGYINGNEEDVCAEGIWQNYFTERPEPLTNDEKRAWLDSRQNAALGSDAFFPFSDNIKRVYASGVKYIAEPGGSIRDDLVIEECDKKGIVMAFTGMRLFHH